MVQITYRKKGIAITQVWFAKTDTAEPAAKTDMVFFHGIPEKSAAKNSFSQEFHTLVSDLNQPEEALFANINKNVRYEIRRNCKEAVEYRVFTPAEMEREPQVICRFAEMYELMYREKGIRTVFNRAQFAAYGKENAILLTAIYESGRPIVFHSYIVEEKQVRLLHSVSDFRSGAIDANLVARANKRLHWEDICLFQKEGKELYDWGGVSDLKNPNGIDAFKFKFGGKPLTYYNIYSGKSLLGKMAVWMMRMKNGK